MTTHTLTIEGQEETYAISADDNILIALREHDVYVKSSCGGHASCNDCLVKVTAGAENLNAPSFEETQLLGNVFHITKERLACQTKIEGPITIDLSKHDKDKDGEKLLRKAKSFKKPKTKVRSKSAVTAMHAERKVEREERQASQDEWQNHWQKNNDDPMKAKRVGGGKRPKSFRTDHLDEHGQTIEETKKAEEVKETKE